MLRFGAVASFQLCSSLVAGEPTPEAWTLDGRPLYPPKIEGLALEALEAQLNIAEDNLRDDVCGGNGIQDPAKQVWYGRRLADQFRYQEAISAFSQAAAASPDYAELYRHRGHRYITTRNFSKAESDLAHAERICVGRPDGWEESGASGPYNLPLSSKHFNVLYHLGLARYLQGDYKGALEAYIKLPLDVMPKAMNDEGIVALAHWRYMTFRRLGRDKEANQSLVDVHPGMRALDGGMYLNLTLMYKGLLTPEDVLGDDPSPLLLATVGYGIGNWYWHNGNQADAVALWQRVVNTSSWPSFGFIAAEADLFRLKMGTSNTPSAAKVLSGPAALMV